jgi:hypothetical protein
MFRQKFWILALLLLFLFLVPAASATPPTDVSGWFAWAEDPYAYCFYTGDFGQPDGILQGCVIQPETPGRAAHGTFYDLPYPFAPPFEPTGECKYNLATFDIPGRPEDPGTPRFTINRCSGSLQGMHLVGEGVPGGYDWQGSMHTEPQ